MVQEFEEREQRVATLQEEVSVCSINCKDAHWWSHSQTPYSSRMGLGLEAEVTWASLRIQ